MEKLVAGQRLSVGVIDGAQHRSPYPAFMHRTRIPQAAVRKPFTTTADGESAKTITHDEARLDIGSAALDELPKFGITPLTLEQLPVLGAR